MTVTVKSISRRAFNTTLGASLLGSMIPLSAFSFPVSKDAADGLLHYNSYGQLYIYSGVGHCSHYSAENPLSLFKDKLNVSEDQCRFMIGDNPGHLPALLSQHLNHLSFSSLKTNEYAVDLLLKEIDKIGGSLEHFLKNDRHSVIESGVTDKTRQIAHNIKENGIIVAVKEVNL